MLFGGPIDEGGGELIRKSSPWDFGEVGSGMTAMLRRLEGELLGRSKGLLGADWNKVLMLQIYLGDTRCRYYRKSVLHATPRNGKWP